MSIKKKMDELGIAVFTGVTPTSQTKGSVTLSDGKKIDCELIVVAIGLSPYTVSLGLENTKVKLDEKGFITVDRQMTTSDPNILAIGDVVGEPMLAHKAIRQGIIAGEVAAGQNSSLRQHRGSCRDILGPRDSDSRRRRGERGHKGVEIPAHGARQGRRARLDGRIREDRLRRIGTVNGVEIVSDEANAMIAEAALAIEMGANLEDIADTIHPHPTYSEAVQEAAELALGRSIHFFAGKAKEMIRWTSRRIRAESS